MGQTTSPEALDKVKPRIWCVWPGTNETKETTSQSTVGGSHGRTGVSFSWIKKCLTSKPSEGDDELQINFCLITSS